MLQLHYIFCHINAIAFPLEALSFFKFPQLLVTSPEHTILWRYHFENWLEWLQATTSRKSGQ